MMTLFSSLYIFLLTFELCISKTTLFPSEWADVGTSTAIDTAESVFALTDFSLPAYLEYGAFYNGSIPIVGYYSDDVHIIDTFNNITYFYDASNLFPPIKWVDATDFSIPLERNFFLELAYIQQIQSQRDIMPDQAYDPRISKSILSGECLTFKCYTQIEEIIYIFYDNIPYIIRYDLQKKLFEAENIVFEHAGYNCLTNNGSHIFAVGDQPNIIIISVADWVITYSDPYMTNIDNEPFTCSMDSRQENIYIFTFYGIFRYSITNDTLNVLYNREYILPYSDYDNSTLTSVTNNAHDVIWIQSAQSIYPFSTVTDRFLPCRVDGSPSPFNPHKSNSLINIGDIVFKMGGVEYDNGSVSFVDLITLVDTNSFLVSDRFIIADWYNPYYALQINYTEGLAELGNATDGFIQLSITSQDFNVEDIYIDIHTSVSASGDDECEICYDGILGAAYCSGSRKEFCLSNGLASDLYGLSSIIDSVNHEHNDGGIDVRELQYSVEVATTVNTVPNSLDLSFVCNSFPIYPVFMTLNISLLSEEMFYLNFDYEYQCNGCSVEDFNDESYAFRSDIQLVSEALGLNGITLQIINQQSCLIIDNDSGLQYDCNNYSLALSEIYFDADYEVLLSSSNTFLERDSIDIQLSAAKTLCRVGTGYEADTNSCHQCLDGTFSMLADLRDCIDCRGLDGVTCGGSSVVMVDFRYWLSGYRQSEQTYITIYEMDNGSIADDDILISHICGYGQCCQLFEGCNYDTAFGDDNGEGLCSNHRDITSAMCTRCEEGNYELLSTNDCGECDYYDNMYYLIGTFSLAFILVLYLSFCDAKPLDIMLHQFRHRNDERNRDDEEYESSEQSDSSEYGSSDNDSENDNAAKLKRKRDKKQDRQSHKEEQKAKSEEIELQFSYFVADSYIANSVLIFQIFVYYFQGYSEILNGNGSRAFISPILNFFNFNYDTSANNTGFCAIPYTTALNEVFMTLILPFLMCFSLFLVYGFCHEGRCCRGNKYCTKPYVSISFYRLLIIIIGIVFRVLMQLITCTRFISDTGNVKDEWEQFYYNDKCFGASWSVSLVTILVIFLYFASVFKKLYHQSDEQRHAPQNKYGKLVGAYKNKYWYWEFVITMRRFIITMFITLSFIGGGYSNLILCLVLIFFLIAHLSVYPFQHTRNNRIESFCILSILIGFIGVNFSDIVDSLFLSFFLGIVIFMPIVIALYYVSKLGCHCYQYIEGNEQYYINSYSNKDKNEKLESMMTRVLHKRPSANITILETKPTGTNSNNTPGAPSYNSVEMVKLSYSRSKRTEDSASSNGLVM